MVQGQDRRKQLQDRNCSASGIGPRGLNPSVTLEVQAEMAPAKLASGQGYF